MTKKDLVDQIISKKSLLCVGLDTDIERIPEIFKKCADPVFEFNKTIIDATQDLCIAYKPNIAFYESLGPKGWESLEKTMEYIPSHIFTIADAKRGDIGNTSKMYAKTYFNYFDFDAVTVAPYMGEDSITPFLDFENKWVIVLGLTSNHGAQDFQWKMSTEGKPLYVHVIEKVQEWGSPNNLMFVVGATQADYMASIRDIAKDYFLLVPGIGAQGGDLASVMHNGKNSDIGLIINSSREIIYAASGDDFHIKVREKALSIRSQMANFLG